MTPLVLIPGMMCDARMWGRVADALGPVRHALPVTGEMVAAMAADILARAPERFALAGLSMGGIVAMEMLHQAPGRITRLALMDTNPLAEAPEVRARRGPQIARALSGDLDGVMRDLGDLPAGFPVIAGSVGPSHAFVHARALGTPVTVFGLRVAPGDLVHADRHGAVVIPPEVVLRLEAGIVRLLATERLILEPARAEGFDFAAFERARDAFEKARS